MQLPQTFWDYNALNKNNSTNELKFVIEITKQAWEIVLKYYWWDQLNTKYKLDKFDPVTQADLESDKYIRAKIKENFPNDKILSEETENTPYLILVEESGWLTL